MNRLALILILCSLSQLYLCKASEERIFLGIVTTFELEPNSEIIHLTMRNSEDIRYTGKILLGSNQQELNVQFDTGSFFLVIPNISLAKNFSHTFDCDASTTCNRTDLSMNITYGISQASGVIIQDQISLGKNLTIIPEVTLLANSWNIKSNTLMDGVFGLGFERNPEQYMTSIGLSDMDASSYNFVTHLKAQGLISKSQFAFFLNSNYDKDVHMRSNFMIGGYDDKYVKGPMVFLDVISDNEWAIRLNSIIIGEETINIPPGKGKALMDTGTSVLTFPQPIYNSIANYITNNTNCESIINLWCVCGDDNGRDCGMKPSDFPDIQFALDGFTAVIKGEAYTKGKDGGVVVEIYSMDTVNEIVILGDTFLRQYLALFDIEGAQIGLAPSINYVDSDTDDVEVIDN